MIELDLHGIIHTDVELEVINFLYLYDNQKPLRIITGRSTPMSNIVVNILKKNNYFFDIPAHNSGEIIVLN